MVDGWRDGWHKVETLTQTVTKVALVIHTSEGWKLFQNKIKLQYSIVTMYIIPSHKNVYIKKVA